MKILVVKLSSLGDLFHALPTVHALKVGLKAEIHWVATTAYVPLVKCFSDVERVIAFPRKGFLSGAPAFMRELRRERYGTVVDLQGLLKSALVTRLARARWRIGPSFHREGSQIFYSAVAGASNRERHAVEQNMDIVRYLGLEKRDMVFPVDLPDPSISAPRPRVALHPVSRWATKTWPLEGFIDVARRLQETCGASLFLLGGPDNVEACARIEQALPGEVRNLAGKSGLVETAALLRQMDLMIGNDSGPLHMAAALGTRTVSVYGPTDPARTGPWGEGHRVLSSSSLDCRPCLSRTCSRNDIACQSEVTSDQVFEAAAEILG